MEHYGAGMSRESFFKKPSYFLAVFAPLVLAPSLTPKAASSSGHAGSQLDDTPVLTRSNTLSSFHIQLLPLDCLSLLLPGL